MLKTIKMTGLALVLAASAGLMTAPAAEARGGRGAGIVAGTIIGLGLLGAYAHERERRHYRHYRSCRQHCEVVGQRCWYTRYGEYVCKDNVRCWRPDHCD